MSSAGQIIGGIVGAVVGFFVGGPAGALKGAWVGMTLGGVIDPPKGPVIRGPRLDDLSVQTATYGAFIPRVYGTTAIHGNVFWVQGDSLIESKVVTESGKGGSSQTTETFEYFASFAVGLCDGPIDGVRRIWIGNQLWYDAGAGDTTSVVASNEKASLFTLYTGTDTQLADPLIQADKGAANVPAYRGLTYIVFDTLPLANYSNSLMGAQVKVEIVSSGVSTSSLTLSKTVSTGPSPFSVSVNGYHAYVSSNPNIEIFNSAKPSDTFLENTASTGGSAESFIVANGNAYVALSDGYVKTYNISISAGISLLGSVATGSYGGLQTNPRAASISGDYLFVTSSNTNTLQVINVVNALSPFVVGVVSTDVDPYSNCISGDFIYVCNISSNTMQVFDISTPTAPVLVASAATNISPRAIDIAGNYAYIANFSNSFQIYDISTPSAPTLVSTSNTSSALIDIAVAGNYAYIANYGGDKLLIYDISTPSAPTLAASAVTGPGPRSVAINGSYVYVVNQSDSTMQVFFFSPYILTSVTTVLSSVVQAECLKSKLLTAADIDVTELTDTVRGYRIGALGAIRAGLDPLRAAWPFDVVQSGYDIKFKKRGSVSVATITAGELDAHAAGDSPGVSITDVREMDLILPYKVGVKYLDAAREYDLNEQYAERLNTDAVNESAIDLPIVFTASEAAGKAETLLYLYWLERYDVMLTLPPSYAHLEPGDVITVEATFATYELRLTSTHHLPDGRVDCRAKYNSASIYTPAAQGAEGESVGATLSLAGPTAYQLLDIPLLRDDHDTAGFPVAMTGYLSGWPGGVLFRSEDGGETWTDLAGFVSPGTVMGYATNTLSAHGGTVYDFASTLTVRLYQGTLASVTEAQLFAAQNWFAYGKDGRWEIIAARTATLQGDGSYILQDFLRGQLGTEWATGLHALNDSIVRLNANDLEFVSVNASTIGSARNYRGITAGKALDTDSNRAFTYNGVNLECLSPVHATGNRHPTTNDWTLTWVRRTRFSGWRDYVDATLGETTESYEVDVYSSSAYTTLMRTLTSATQTVSYTSANQVTDFGSNQATLYLKIYQLSATVGRGYPLTISITR